MKNNKGFTFFEIVIVLIISVILSIITIVHYRVYAREAMVIEGKTLAGSVARLEKAHYCETGRFLRVIHPISSSDILGIDASDNKYFKYFTVEVPGKYNAEFSVVTKYDSDGEHDIFIRLYGFHDKVSTYETDFEQTW